MIADRNISTQLETQVWKCIAKHLLAMRTHFIVFETNDYSIFIFRSFKTKFVQHYSNLTEHSISFCLSLLNRINIANVLNKIQSVLNIEH